ncbi:MAG: hypothetical protein IKW74_07735 [Thermoguttaceae bacterium]|nr:hypothetical protein [Thermoguttaceae bacterium]
MTGRNPFDVTFRRKETAAVESRVDKPVGVYNNSIPKRLSEGTGTRQPARNRNRRDLSPYRIYLLSETVARVSRDPSSLL